MNNDHTAEAKMLIRRPAPVVFQAFVDPAVTTNFWFTRSTGSLEEGKTVTWYWEMYGVSGNVQVKQLIPNEKIVINWGDPPTTVEFEFLAVADDKTYVIIQQYGFDLTGDELIHAIKDSTGGFTTVLAGLKAYLEHGLNLNLIADKYPKELGQPKK